MKKIFSFLMIGILTCCLWSCSDDDDPDYQIISYEKLPSQAKNFVSSYFPSDQVVRVEAEVEHDGAEYDVILKSGSEIEFNGAGEWVSVEAAYGQAVPQGIVPQSISEYVAGRYSPAVINEISRGIPAWEIELNNGIEISFNSQFQVIEVDY